MAYFRNDCEAFLGEKIAKQRAYFDEGEGNILPLEGERKIWAEICFSHKELGYADIKNLFI